MDFQLVVLRGRSSTTALKLGDGVTTAGRHDECQLRIKSSEVSRKHCQFYEKNGMLLLKDLGSSNGTFLNGKKIEGQRVLEPGDELSIGPIKLRVEKVGQPAPAAKPAASTAASPADTAVPLAVPGPGKSSAPAADEFEIDFGDEILLEPEEKTVTSNTPEPTQAPAAAAPAASPSPSPGATLASATKKPAPAPAPSPPPQEEPGLGDDAIADFLLDLKIDEED